MGNLAGKKAMVTGGARGIGAGIVKRLAEAGAAVGFTYHTREDAASALSSQIKAAGGRATALKADSSDPKQLLRAVDAIAESLGGLDIFVSSAGALLFKPVEPGPHTDVRWDDGEGHMLSGKQAVAEHLARAVAEGRREAPDRFDGARR